MRIEDLRRIRFFPLVFLLAFWVAVAGFRPIEREPPPLVEEEWVRLERGEVVIGAERSRQGHGGRVLAAILIDSPVEPLWEIMIDHKRAPEFVPGLRKCKILERDEEGELLEHRVKFSWFLPEMTYVFRAWYLVYERIDFKRVRGDLKSLEGSWFFEETRDGNSTILRYSVYVDPGFLIPQWLVRPLLKGELTSLMRAVRRRVSELSQQEKNILK
jgi:ribosome-associated toxin RatA of RatAB toxin-antitoxin module